MEIRHVKCRGTVIFDATGLFTLRSQTVSISPNGAYLDLLEITERENKGDVICTCKKCEDSISLKTDSDSIEIKCMVCNNYHPASKIGTTTEINIICKNCYDMLSQKETSDSFPEFIKKIRTYLILPSSIKFIPVLEVMTKKIRA